MLVSVITPSYNSEQYIVDTYKSLALQTYTNWEWLVTDDCSTDSTYTVLEGLMRSDSRIKIFRNTKNLGAAVSRNNSINESKGRFICFLDSDDLWKPNKLETQIEFMRERKLSFTYSEYDVVCSKGLFIKKISVPKETTYKNLLKGNVIGCLTAMYDTKYFGKVYMPVIRKRQDFGLWLKLLKRSNKAYGINESLGCYRVRSGSVSSNKVSAALYTWKLYRDVEKLNLLKSIYYFSFYIVGAFVKHFSIFNND